MMQFHTQGIENAQEKIVQARQLLEFMAQNVAASNPYGMLLRSELQALSVRANEYAGHDFFETNNIPVYFHEFASSLSAQKLRHVCEADVESTFQGDVKRDTLETLERISGDEIRLEQYLDFLRSALIVSRLFAMQAKLRVGHWYPQWSIDSSWNRSFFERSPQRTSAIDLVASR